MDATHITYQKSEGGFRVKYDLCIPESLVVSNNDLENADTRELFAFDQRFNTFLKEYSETADEIERLTSHTDGVDCISAVISGLLAGLIDSFVVGKWDFKAAKAISNHEINNQVLDFAKKNGMTAWAQKNGKDPGRLETAIQFLEEKFKLPGDGAYKPYKNAGITDATHHLDDFCHHPTFVGLICCILVQFTGSATYCPSSGSIINVPVEVNGYGNFASNNPLGKIFSGIVNWFFVVARTISNRKGHLYSDIAGSSSSAKKGNEGAGLPGTFLSIAKELSVLPCFRDSMFAENLRKAYQNGIGSRKSQVDLGTFNALFEGASSKLDIRTEMAIGHELKRQSIPVVINEIIVRSVYFVRRFIEQMREKSNMMQLEWRKLIPAKNRTIVRMLTISTGTLELVDLADAAIRSAVENGFSGGFPAGFIVRVNFVGIGRFSVSCATDIVMGIHKNRLELALTSGDIALAAASEIKTIEAVRASGDETDRLLAQASKQSTELASLQF